MNDNEKAPEYDSDLANDSGDVEILEVVGVDDDLPAPSTPAKRMTTGNFGTCLNWFWSVKRVSLRPGSRTLNIFLG